MDIGGLLFGAAKGATSHLEDMAGAAVTMESIAKTGKAPKVLMAPNGKPSKLTPEQWAEVRTPAFKKGFGDWENDPANAIKLLDENGEPRVTYHMTGNDFDTFKVGNGIRGGAIWTGASKDYQPAFHHGVTDSRVLPLYANIKNPYVIDTVEKQRSIGDRFPGFPHYQSPEAVQWLKDNGYDGTVFDGKAPFPNSPRDLQDHFTEFTVYNPNQLKSAVGNNGSFDMTDPNIYKALTALPFGGAILGGMTTQGGRK